MKKSISLKCRGCIQVKSVENIPDIQHKRDLCKFDATNWLSGIPEACMDNDMLFAEVRFKHDRKEIYKITDEQKYYEGDLVAVESDSGHDIGIVSLFGETAKLQMKRKGIHPNETKKIYRKVRSNEIEKWISFLDSEQKTFKRAKEIIQELGLEMKLNDVEIQGDGSKAIFSYTAENRVDFRELIKVLATEFRLRIEMMQIGVRQESSKLGGIGSCGRELCCASWNNSFNSVSTSTLKNQQLSNNPQKITGHCQKLKCCLNYEDKAYEDELKKFPHLDTVIHTKKGIAGIEKIDVFKNILWLSYKDNSHGFIPISLKDMKQLIHKNKNRKPIEKIEDFAITTTEDEVFADLEFDDISRFDNQNTKKRRRRK